MAEYGESMSFADNEHHNGIVRARCETKIFSGAKQNTELIFHFSLSFPKIHFPVRTRRQAAS